MRTTEEVLADIHKDLLSEADETVRQGFHRFFREEVRGYGVPANNVRRIARKYYIQIRERDKEEIWRACETLLRTDCQEDALIAFDWAYRLHPWYSSEDFDVFEGWIGRYVNNWAKCDTLCNHAVGTFLEQFPEFLSRIKEWTGSGNRWFRRAAAVSLILPARKGRFLEEVLEIADRLLTDRDDLVQKGYGWMLKEASKQHPDEIVTYVMRHRHNMPRIALRYAIEKMPPEVRRQVMANDRDRRSTKEYPEYPI